MLPPGKKVDYAPREEMAMQSRISDEDYRDRGVPFSCCNLHAMAPCTHTEMTDNGTINLNGCVEVISPILYRIVIVAYIMTGTLIVAQALLGFSIARVRLLRLCQFCARQTLPGKLSQLRRRVNIYVSYIYTLYI